MGSKWRPVEVAVDATVCGAAIEVRGVGLLSTQLALSSWLASATAQSSAVLILSANSAGC
jgi:hypothetical protein